MSKKPAKRKITEPTPLAPKVDYGVRVLYVGSKTTMFVCPKCGKTTRRGMIQEYKGTLFCSKGCVSVFKKESELGAV